MNDYDKGFKDALEGCIDYLKEDVNRYSKLMAEDLGNNELENFFLAIIKAQVGICNKFADFIHKNCGTKFVFKDESNENSNCSSKNESKTS